MPGISLQTPREHRTKKKPLIPPKLTTKINSKLVVFGNEKSNPEV